MNVKMIGNAGGNHERPMEHCTHVHQLCSNVTSLVFPFLAQYLPLFCPHFHYLCLSLLSLPEPVSLLLYCLYGSSQFCILLILLRTNISIVLFHDWMSLLLVFLHSVLEGPNKDRLRLSSTLLALLECLRGSTQVSSARDGPATCAVLNALTAACMDNSKSPASTEVLSPVAQGMSWMTQYTFMIQW